MLESGQTHSDNRAALLSLLRADAAALPPEDAWDGIVALAQRQGVAPLLLRGLKRSGRLGDVPEAVARTLEEAFRTTALQNLRLYGELQRVARALEAAQVPFLPLKGLHLAELAYGDIGLRPMVDMDILVPPGQVAEALRALRALGFGHDEELGDSAQALRGDKCNIGLAQAERGSLLEVHWALDEMHKTGDGPLADIWATARTARFGSREQRVMAPEFLLLHVCAHLACNHSFAFSLRALCDVVEILAAHPELDWARVAASGARGPWARGVAASLRLAHDHLGAPVPAKVLAELGADRLDPGMLREALEHLLDASELPDALVTAPNLLAAAGSQGLGAKARLFWRRLFLPRAELAVLYGVRADSPRLLLCYAARLRDLLRRYAAAAWQLFAGDPEVAVAARRHVRLEHWVMGRPGPP